MNERGTNEITTRTAGASDKMPVVLGQETNW